jgi:ribosome maturation protein Sdo1
VVVEPVTTHNRRELLRDERRALVAAISRRTGEPHRVIHARVNRATGAPSVSDATADQLEKGNRLLETEAR